MLTDADQPRRFLVLGAAGFLGAHLCRELLQRGHSICWYDNMSTGQSARMKSLSWQFDDRVVEFHSLDTARSIDGIFHLASPASPAQYWKPENVPSVIEANGTLTPRVIALAIQNACPLIFASSSEVYGDADVIPTPETYVGRVNPLGPRAHYDTGKLFSEGAISAAALGLSAGIVRFFNVYGPGMSLNDGRLVPSVINALLHGGQVTVEGDGSQTRSLTYVDDAIAGLLAVANRAQILSNAWDVFNIGNPEEVSVLDIVKRLVLRWGRDPELAIRYLPARQEEITRRVPDVRKARRVLRWKPKVGVGEGLDATAAWYRAGRYEEES